MVKNFQALNRMRSSPAMNTNYYNDNSRNNTDNNNMNSQQSYDDPRGFRYGLAPDGPRRSQQVLDTAMEDPSNAEQAQILSRYLHHVRLDQARIASRATQPNWDEERSQLAAAQQELDRLDKVIQDALASKAALNTPPTSSSSTASTTSKAPIGPQASKGNAKIYTKPFCDFLTDNPTVFHAVDALAGQLKRAGYTALSERDAWDIKKGGKYYVERNGSSLIAFVVGEKYESGNGAAILAGHVDALTAKLKPVSKVSDKAGFVQLGVAPYAGGLGPTWWDRDLSIGGRVLVKEGGKISSKLVKLDWPIAKIPTLAPHFGAPANGPFNQETQMTPIIGLESSDPDTKAAGKAGTFTSTQPPRLVRAIANELGIEEEDYSNIVQWELELFDLTPAGLLGLDKEFITAGRIDDKLCSWAALQALLNSGSYHTPHSGIIKVVGLFDDEEIGSGLRQGARGNLLPTVIERAVGAFAGGNPASDLVGRTYANSFLVSSDVTHAVNPNFENVYLTNHAPALNVGISVSADSNGHMTTDSVSTAIFQLCADRVGAKLQVFQIRNDSRSGGTVGPMLSSATGIRAIDVGIPQLSMHSIRATTGSLDPGLGVLCFEGFLNGFEDVDRGFREG